MNPTAPPSVTSYDVVPYTSHPYAQTHPDRLFTIATLFGLRPNPIGRCRVLELGCAAGGNLLPMAEALPDSEFVGIDLSARQIEEGQRTLRELNLTNVTLRHASILDVDESYGAFDYVICHGVFSWVPPPVQEKIFDVIATRTNPGGVGYVSYNTYPGWHMRGMIRDMMRYHAERFTTPADRVQQARALLDFMARSTRPDTTYSAHLKAELEALRYQADHYLYHEHLEEVNDPLYFHQFASRAAARGLRYLGEARVGTMVTGNLGPEVEATLSLLAPDQIRSEQYMDFLRNRMFRESLLVSARTSPNWSIRPESLRELHASSGARPAADDPVDVKSDAPAKYRSAGGAEVSTRRPVVKAALRVLADAWPGTLPFADLRREVEGLLDIPAEARGEAERTLAHALLNCYMGSDLVELHGGPISIVRAAGEKPVACPLARMQAVRSPVVTTRRHEVARLSDFEGHLLPFLDGSRDRAALVGELLSLASKGQLTVSRDGQSVPDQNELRVVLTGAMEQALANLSRNALLIG